MKVILFFAVSLIIFVMFNSFTNKKMNKMNNEGQHIDFYEGTWKEALSEAKKSEKLIFLDLYATWCGPCKMMKYNSFQNQKVADFYNQKFINVEIDGESKLGNQLMRKYNLNSFPSLLFLNTQGEIVHGGLGYHSPSELLNLGKEALK